MSVNEQAPTSDLTKALSRLAGNRHSDGVSSIVSADDRSVIINGCYEMMVALKAPSQRVQALEEEEFAIDKLRFRAFHTNSEADRQVYFDAVSKWFQDRHYRRMDAERALSSQPVADGWLPVTNGLNAIGFEIGGGYVLKLSYDNLRQFEAAHKSITSRLPASTGASE